MPYTYEYPRPAVCVDIVVFTSDTVAPEILLIKRKFNPFKDHWALPGGFVNMDEELTVAASRELEEETSLTDIKLEQFKTFGKIGRDPRGRTISVVYYGFISENQKHLTKANDDASETKWFSIMSLPDLAFDHLEIINEATEKISK
jgi:8-oxo-dGTP diphosphatase